MKDFKDKILFITGGASGAGLGQAKVFAEAGCKVVIADIRQDHIDEAVEAVFGGPPQLLFNTAGVNAFGPAEASTFEDYDWIIGVDLFGVINGLVTFVPRMIKAGKGGHIAAVASMGGLMGGPTTAPYSAAKAAVINLMESYYLSLKPYGIGVSCLCPGGIRTNIGESSYTRPKKLENTGYNTNETTISFMRHHYSFGIDPEELARILKKGIEEDILYVLPVPEPEKMMQGVAERLVNYTTPEGMKRQNELETKRREERRLHPAPSIAGGEEAGWGKARPDLTWVKPSSRWSGKVPKKKK
jgi:NAD(P)-dependent dehydrogenase (short-subunit alcohol dehydrogenase family)